MIASSFLTQYGIRISQELHNMSWREFSAYVSGLGPDTPLGRVVSIRAENDPDVLKYFTKDQKRIRSEYKNKKAKQMTDNQVANAMEALKNAFVRMAGVGNENEETKM